MTPAEVITRWRGADERQLLLQVIQPALIGLIDGTISTLAPIFAAAYLAGSREALLVGLAAALGAAISMGMSEGLSDDGELTGRGTSLSRGLITGFATFAGGTFHALPFLISDIDKALTIAYIVVSIELLADRVHPQALPVGVAHPFADPGDRRRRAGGRRRRDHRERVASSSRAFTSRLGAARRHASSTTSASSSSSISLRCTRK